MGFEIRIINLHWMQGDKDDPIDECLHGNVFVRIGDEILDDGSIGDWTVSVGAFRMLESLLDDRIEGEYMLPCDGFCMQYSKYEGVYFICGVDGIHWTVEHDSDKSTVKLVSKGNTFLPKTNRAEVTIPFADYERAIHAFADEIKAFYDACSPKEPPDNPACLGAYQIFWEHWEKMRNGERP